MFCGAFGGAGFLDRVAGGEEGRAAHTTNELISFVALTA